MAKLLIVESPHKARVIKGFLGKEWKVIPTVGHFLELPLPKNMTEKQKERYGSYAIDLEDGFVPLWKPIPKQGRNKGSSATIKKLREEIGKAEVVYIGTDADDQGNLIGKLIVETFKPTVPTYRVTWNEITKSAVEKGIKDKELIDVSKRLPKSFWNSSEAALSQVSWDRLYGFATSPYTWKTLGPGLALHEDTLIPTWGFSDKPVEETVRVFSGTCKEDTVVTYENYSYKRMKDIEIGDIIIDNHGNPTTVLDKYLTNDESFEITFDKQNQKETILASGGHIWSVEDENRRLPFKEYQDTLLSWKTPRIDEEAKNKLQDWLNKQGNLIPKNDLLAVLSGALEVNNYAVGKLLDTHCPIVIKKSPRFLYDFKKLKKWTEEKHDSRLAGIFKKADSMLIDGVEYTKFITDEKILERGDRQYSGRELKEFREEGSGFVDFKAHSQNIYKKEDIEKLLTILSSPMNPRYKKRPPMLLKTTREMYDEGVTHSKGYSRYSVPLTRVKYPEKDLLIDPYTLGIWLGDGLSDRGSICGLKADLEQYRKYIPYKSELKEDKGTDKREHMGEIKIEGLKEKLRSLEILQDYEKHNFSKKQIPQEYLQSSVEQRLELLAGLIDTDGCVVEKEGYVFFANTNYLLAKQVKQLVNSLGYKPSLQTNVREDKRHKTIYKIRWSFKNEEIMSKLSRKRARWRKGRRDARADRRYIKNIEKVDTNDKFYCIKVDSPDSLFLCGESFIPTHNSSGRVQTPGARLVVERELRRLRFKSVPYYSITGNFEGVEGKLEEIKGKKIAGGAQIDDDGNLQEGYSLITDENVDKIVAFLKSKNYEISDVSSRAYRRNPPPPFTTSTALQAIGGKTGMGTKQITSILQKLYDQESLITYLRTVSIEAAPEAIEAARKSIEKKFGKHLVPTKPNIFKDKKADNSGHECLRSVVDEKTGLLAEKTLTNKRDNDVFQIVSKRMMASQSIPVEGTTWIARISSDDGEAVFRASETEIHEPGWTTIYEEDKQ